LAAPLHAKTSGTQPQPNSGTTRDDKAERAESGSAGEEHEYPESENERPESAHDRNAPDDQDDDNGCI
jgi:hypothetical protein